MLAIHNHHLLEDKIPGWKPTDLVYIMSIRHYCNEMDKKWYIELSALFQQQIRGKGWPNFDEEFIGVEMVFKDVLQDDLKMPEFTPMQFTGFDIIDISDEKKNDAKFLIEDYEDGDINFYCNAITIPSVKGKLYVVDGEVFIDD